MNYTHMYEYRMSHTTLEIIQFSSGIYTITQSIFIQWNKYNKTKKMILLKFSFISFILNVHSLRQKSFTQMMLCLSVYYLCALLLKEQQSWQWHNIMNVLSFFYHIKAELIPVGSFLAQSRWRFYSLKVDWGG